MEMIAAKLYTVQDIAGATPTCLQAIISAVDDKNLVANAIKTIAVELNKPEHNGRMPTTKDGLLACGMDDSVASLLMQHVFGSTELLVGLDTRKLLVALDMIDWEESGTAVKTDVKMAKISPDRVRKSLATWLPKGEGRTFQDLIEDMAQILGENPVGFWGKLTRLLNANFSTKDKNQLTKMAESVISFYRATKGKAAKRRSCG